MTATASPQNPWVLAWALGGVALLLLQAISRLAPRAGEAIQAGLSPLQWALLVLWCLVSAYAEGHRGFHLRFSPRVVSRAFYLASQPWRWRSLLAPAFAMSLFHASRRSLLRSWGLVTGIIVLVVLVHRLPQPWRGIIDAGVVVGLCWGLVSIAVHAMRAFQTGPNPVEDLPPVASEQG